MVLNLTGVDRVNGRGWDLHMWGVCHWAPCSSRAAVLHQRFLSSGRVFHEMRCLNPSTFNKQSLGKVGVTCLRLHRSLN